MRSLNLIKTILIEGTFDDDCSNSKVIPFDFLGNIAAGKSTIMSHIASTYPSNLIQVHREPVENWMNIKGFDLLKALYNESNRWTFAFEMTALLSRIKNHTKAVNNHHIHVYERSILSCFHVFIRHDLEEKYLNDVEYRILQDHYEYGLQKSMDLSTTAILYFDLSPKECLDRIRKRSRQSETNIDLKRLEQLKYHYDKFIQNFKLCPVQIIDASQSIEQTYQEVDSILTQFIKQNQINDKTQSPIITE
jgi:deoxyadenosine/deoxycytidine kinase